MKFRIVFRMLGTMLIFISAAMFISLLVSFVYQEDIFPFVFSITIALLVGIPLRYFLKEEDEIGHLEGFAVASLTWFIVSMFAALPYIFGGVFESFVDAYFESVSGFTTTGSTVLKEIEIVPKGILFWRSMTQWLGGMGIIVLAVALLPNMAIGGMKLFAAEVPGPTKDKIVPRVKDTAKILWLVYFGLTFLEIVLLLLGDMSLYDAVNHAFTTLPTGGYSVKNESIAAYQSSYIDWVVAIFMVIGGMNFTLHYLFLIRGKVSAYFKNTEFLFYSFIVFLSTVLITINLYWHNFFSSISDAIRCSFFSVSTMISTGGFASGDFDAWPDFSRYILILLPLLGGCVGSTGGGFKGMRVFILMKYAYRSILKKIYPNIIKSLKLDGEIIPKVVLSEINSLFFIFVFTIFASSLIISAFGYDILTSFTAVTATLTNSGPGLNLVGPTQNFAFFHPVCKMLFSILMILGRLEFFSVLVFMLVIFRRRA